MTFLEVLGICFIIYFTLIFVFITIYIIDLRLSKIRHKYNYADLQKLLATGKVELKHTKDGETESTSVKDLHKYAETVEPPKEYEDLKKEAEDRKHDLNIEIPF